MTNAPRTALIIGSAGQDGTLLEGHLREIGTRVFGLLSDGIVVAEGEHVGLAPINDADAIRQLVTRLVPDEVYYLAAHHHSSEAAPEPEIELWRRSFAVHCEGLLHILEALVSGAPHAHLVYASSSHVFGEPVSTPQDETTPLHPQTPYAVTKAAGMGICATYRAQGIRASAAILFNHESLLRPASFVVPRIARAVAAAAVAGEQAVRIELGNPDAIVDWSWAPDVVRALAGMARLDDAADVVVASGVAHTVRELCEVAAAHAGLEVEVVARPSSSLRRVPPLIGNPARLHARIALPPPVPFTEWVGMMVDAARVELSCSRQSPDETPAVAREERSTTGRESVPR
jgi:GDPmannose 4,6-dehydratase